MVLILSSVPSQALEFSLLGAGSWNSPTSASRAIDSGSLSVTPGYGYSTGLLVDYRLERNPRFSVQSGLLYTQRNYQGIAYGGLGFTSTFTQYTEQLTHIRAPMLLRVAITRGLSAGIGIYFAYGMGNIVDTSIVTQAGPQSSRSSSYEAYSFSRIDYGLEGGVAYRFALTDKMALLADLRATQGVVSSTSSVILRDVHLGVGLTLNAPQDFLEREHETMPDPEGAYEDRSISFTLLEGFSLFPTYYEPFGFASGVRGDWRLWKNVFLGAALLSRQPGLPISPTVISAEIGYAFRPDKTGWEVSLGSDIPSAFRFAATLLARASYSWAIHPRWCIGADLTAQLPLLVGYQGPAIWATGGLRFRI